MTRLSTFRFFSFPLLFWLSGCGVGLCVGDNAGGCLATGIGPRLLLSGLDGLSVRKNDCYPVTLSAVDAAGVAMNQVTANAIISASAGVVIYQSLAGCQTYDSSFEQSQFTLTPTAPQVTFYFRCDVEGAVSLSASTASETGLASAQQPLVVHYTAFDGSKGPNGTVFATARDSSGRTYLGGSFRSYDDYGVSYLARLRADGSLDASLFPTEGGGLNGPVQAMALQSDGKVLVGGFFTSYGGISRQRIARLHSDGSLDGFFTPGSGFDGTVQALALQTDGKVFVGGNFTQYNGTARGRVARLLSDGSLDTSFVPTGSGVGGVVYALAVQSDGKLIVGGSFTNFNGTARQGVARLNADGSLDTAFLTSGVAFNSSVWTLALQSDGRLLVGGNFVAYNVTPRPYIARLFSDGTLDASFAQTGTGLSGDVRSIEIQTDGKVAIAGQFTAYDGTSRGRIARLNADGTLDTGFAPSGLGFDGTVYALSLQSDGQLVASGSFSSHSGSQRARVARVTAEGALDTAFAPASGTGFNNAIQTLTILPDNRALAGGWFTAYDGTAMGGLALLKSDGSRDTSFALSGTAFDNIIQASGVQSDGRFVLGGLFTNYNGTTRPYLARLNTDGSLDTAYTFSGTGFNNPLNALAVQTDGKVIAGGDFTSYNGTARPFLARLTLDGSLDTSFLPTGTGLGNRVHAIALQNDGKIVVGGLFTAYNGTGRGRVARINADGSLDTTFATTGTGLNLRVYAVSVQTDGKILVGGEFTSYNGTASPYVARLNSNGSLDPSFSPTGLGLDDFVYAVGVQADGRVLVGGDFTEYNGTSRFHIARLNGDGSLDTSFAPSGTGLNNEVYAIGIQSSGKVVIGGNFTGYDTSTTNYLARLTYIGTLD